MSLSAFAGGGWTLQKGEVWIQTSATYINGESLFTGTDPFRTLQRPISDLTIQLYGEYGFSDKLTLMGSLPFKFLSSTGDPVGSLDFDTLEEGSMKWFGNYRLGAKYRVSPNGAPLAVSVLGWIESNNSDMNQYTGLQTGYNAWSFSPGIALGKSFEKSYLSVDAIFTFRTNQHSEELGINMEYGFKIMDSWWLAGVLSVQKSLKNGEYKNCNFEQTGLYANNQESVNYGIKALVPIKSGLGVTAAVYGSLYGDKLPAYPSLNFGIYWNGKTAKKQEDKLIITPKF
ncbi:MAG: hypothetical protein ACI959_000360 [Limisphaerales bacterium]|jgi:hypothetical protein